LAPYLFSSVLGTNAPRLYLYFYGNLPAAGWFGMAGKLVWDFEFVVLEF